MSRFFIQVGTLCLCAAISQSLLANPEQNKDPQCEKSIDDSETAGNFFSSLFPNVEPSHSNVPSSKKERKGNKDTTFKNLRTFFHPIEKSAPLPSEQPLAIDESASTQLDSSKIPMLKTSVDAAQKKTLKISSKIERQGNLMADAKNPPKAKAPVSNKGYCFALHADYLLMRAEEEGLSYGYTAEATVENKAILKNKYPHFNWSSGVRVGIGGYPGPKRKWDLGLTGTYLLFRNHASTSIFDPMEMSFSPAWAINLLGVFGQNGHVNWKLRYNTWDFALGRAFCLGKRVQMRPHIGIREALIYQKYTAQYTSEFQFIDNTGTHQDLFRPSKLFFHNNFLGIGPRTGFDLSWFFNTRWAITGKFDAAFLIGRFGRTQNIYGWSLNNPVLQPFSFNTHEHFYRTRVNLGGTLGFKYQRAFNHDRVRLWTAVNYEITEWFDQNQFNKYDLFPFLSFGNGQAEQQVGTMADTQQGNLAIQGLSVQFGLDY